MSRKVNDYVKLVVVAIVVMIAGCVSIRSYRNIDPHVITHHTWWNYYQRGRLYLREGNYAAARKDFETALGRIPGARYPYTQERWRARTYGMHMLEGYFPHRELGICHFEMNEPNEALKLLETSMKMEPSARAKFYINAIHEQLAEAAAPPPTIRIAAFSDWTQQQNIVLEGTVQGTSRIANLTINDKSEFIELATKRVSFRKRLELKEGSNEVRVVAKDVAGKQTATNLVLYADWTTPQIYLQRTGPDLAITCRDNLELNQLRINDHTILPTAKEYTIHWTIKPDQSIRLAVSDHAGNQTDWTLSEKELLHMAQSQIARPPRLELDHAGKTLVLFNPEYELDIRAEDDTALKAVELNGEDLLTHFTPLFRTMHRIPLGMGTNVLTLTAIDFDENQIDAHISVIYRRPEYLDSIYRLAAMLAPLSGEIPTPMFAKRVGDLFVNELTIDPVRFYLLANEDEAGQLQQERMLSESELVDPRAILKTGKKLDADLLFITRVLSDAPGQTVYTEVIDAHSGETLFIEDIYLEDPILLPAQIGGLVMKIEQHFPLVQGRIQKMDKRLTIDAGEVNGTYKGMRMLVIRSKDSFRQGRVVHDGNHPLELVVSGVESETADVIIPRGQPRNSVLSGDYVFSR